MGRSGGLVSLKANRTLTIKGRRLGMGRHGILLRKCNHETTSKDKTLSIGYVSTRIRKKQKQNLKCLWGSETLIIYCRGT